jgi:hypothetical protein
MDKPEFCNPSSVFQEVTFEVIKAKHKNIHAFFSKDGDPLLLELADMILLFSAQMAQVAGVPSLQTREPRDRNVRPRVNRRY